jgi:hypothetical protein
VTNDRLKSTRKISKQKSINSKIKKAMLLFESGEAIFNMFGDFPAFKNPILRLIFSGVFGNTSEWDKFLAIWI